jgi:hypothetical protein
MMGCRARPYPGKGRITNYILQDKIDGTVFHVRLDVMTLKDGYIIGMIVWYKVNIFKILKGRYVFETM